MLHYECEKDGSGYFFEVEETISRKTRFQNAFIGNSRAFGKVFILDGDIQMAEKDEKRYHEHLIHPAMAVHPNPKNILILGGGDGCAVREAVKWDVEKVVMVDIDGEVVEMAKEHLKDINKGALEHPKLELVIDDAVKYVKETPEKFDIIYMDLVDPEGECRKLYLKNQLLEYKKLLNRGGILVTHSQSSDNFLTLRFYEMFRRIFKNAVFYVTYVNSFNSDWSFVMGSDETGFFAEEKELKKRLEGKELTHYMAERHNSMLKIEPYFRKEIERLKGLSDEEIEEEMTGIILHSGFLEDNPFVKKE